MLGVVNVLPVLSKFPPVAASYQRTVPVLGLALKVKVPAPQRLAGVPVSVGIVLIVAKTAVLDEAMQPLNASA